MNASSLAFRQEFPAPAQVSASPNNRVGRAVLQLRQLLLERQHADGSWCELLSGGGLLEAELLILLAFLKRENDSRIPRLIRALLDRQVADGGWAGSSEGPADVDATALACLALTLTGTAAESEALNRGRLRLAGWGTAGRCSSPTRLLLALFGLVAHADDWRTLPTYTRVEEWAIRVIDAYRPVRPMPKDQAIAGLFRDELRLPSGKVYNPMRWWNARQSATELQHHFAELGSDSINGPTSVLPALALGCLDAPNNSPVWDAVWRGFDERMISSGGCDYVAPFASPIRDTAESLIALRSADLTADAKPLVTACEWLWNRLVRGQARGDLAIVDAALSLIALARTDYAFRCGRHSLVEHVVYGLLDEQTADGGWGTPDQTGLVLEAVAEFGLTAGDSAVNDAIRYLERVQSSDAAWSSPLSVNQLHATWRVLKGLRAAQSDPNSAMIRRAIAWLNRKQHAGGAWGESTNADTDGLGEPSAVQTAWALQALISANETASSAVEAGVEWLLANREESGGWTDNSFTGRDPRGPHRHPLYPMLYPLAALAEFERCHGDC